MEQLWTQKSVESLLVASLEAAQNKIDVLEMEISTQARLLVEWQSRQQEQKQQQEHMLEEVCDIIFVVATFGGPLQGFQTQGGRPPHNLKGKILKVDCHSLPACVGVTRCSIFFASLEYRGM